MFPNNPVRLASNVLKFRFAIFQPRTIFFLTINNDSTIFFPSEYYSFKYDNNHSLDDASHSETHFLTHTVLLQELHSIFSSAAIFSKQLSACFLLIIHLWVVCSKYRRLVNIIIQVVQYLRNPGETFPPVLQQALGDAWYALHSHNDRGPSLRVLGTDFLCCIFFFSLIVFQISQNRSGKTFSPSSPRDRAVFTKRKLVTY